MKKVFILSLAFLTSLGLGLKAVESAMNIQNSDIQLHQISNDNLIPNQHKGLIASHDRTSAI